MFNLQDEKDTAKRVDKLLTHILIGGENRFNCFCTALNNTGQHNIVDEILKPKLCIDRSDAVPVDATVTAACASSRTTSTTSLQGADEFLRPECVANLRDNWNALYSDIRCDEEFLGYLPRLDVFTDMQIKKLKVCELFLQC